MIWAPGIEKTEVIVDANISCVLPVALHEPGMDENLWRHSPNDGAYIRVRLMLLSFLRMFRQDDLGQFFLVCPEADISTLTTLLRSLTDDERYQVVSEQLFCPEVALFQDRKTGAIQGWYAQQLIKLAAAEHISSDYYITFDSDIICTKPSSYAELIPRGRALLNIETPDDYTRLYKAETAAKAVKNRDRRFKGCRKLLGGPRPRAYAKRYYGETPVILHTHSVRALCNHIGTLANNPWQAALASDLHWTEYCLYFQYLEMNNAIDAVHELSHCNAVLNWENSIWHMTKRYRLPRDYTSWPCLDADRNHGYFSAVQSRLNPAEWLPSNTPTQDAFYDAVEKRILGFSRYPPFTDIVSDFSED